MTSFIDGTCISRLSIICMDIILKDRTFQDLPSVMILYNRVDLMLPLHLPLRTFVINFLRDRYPLLLDAYGSDEMARIFHAEDLELFRTAYEDHLNAKARFASLTGTVLEPTRTGHYSKSDDGFYPLEALLQGSVWPSEVDCRRREQYLSSDDFVKVFKMTKEEFCAKKQFVRDRLKKEQKLY